MERLTKTFDLGKVTFTFDLGGVAFTFDLDITCQPSEIKNFLNLATKLKEYENLEELIGIPLKELAEIFKQHIPGDCKHPKKAIVLTDGDVDKWRKYKDLEEQDDLVSIPNEAYFIKDRKIQSGWVQEAVSSICRKLLLDIQYDDNSLKHYRGCLGNDVFLTKEEAKARLEELGGNQNGKV